jgi:hypothetical protein
MYYFGYGSNMLTSRLQERVPSGDPVRTGTLRGYALRFHKRSRDGSGKCNIVPSSDEDARVHGVVFDVSSADLRTLDEAEQRGRGYERRNVVVRGAESAIEAFAYVAQPAYVDDALLPYDWYHALVLAGAREHDLPSSYTAQVESVRSYPDPNEARRREHRHLLHDAGCPLLKQ